MAFVNFGDNMFNVDEDGEIHAPFIRTGFNYDTDTVSMQTALFCEDVSLTQQQFAEQSDINTIVRQFGLTGQLPTDVAVPMSGDFDTVVDFQSALNIVRAGEEAFMEMPAEVRQRFGNDPGMFLAFANDDKNRDEARKLGLLLPEAVVKKPEPMLVRVMPEPIPGESTSKDGPGKV